MSPKFKGILLTLASAAMVSVTFIASKQALKELTPLAFTPIWFGIASLWGIGFHIFFTDHSTPLPVRQYARPLILIGVASSAANYFFFSAIKLGDPTVVSFFSRSETIFSLLWGVYFLKERLTRWQWLGALITVLGAGLMTYQGGTIIFTVLALALVSQFFNSLTSLIAKMNVKNLPPSVLGLARTIGLTVILGIIAIFTGEMTLPSTPTLLWMVGGSFFGPFLSFVLYYNGLKWVDMGQASIIRATQPFFVAIYSLAIFGSLIAPLQLVGGVIILAGVAFMLSAGSNKLISSMTNPLMMFRKNNSRRENNHDS